MLSTDLEVGDQVAIMPNTNSSPSDILGIGEIAYVGPVIVRLVGGGEYFIQHGLVALDFRNCIVPMTDEHRTALVWKRDATA